MSMTPAEIEGVVDAGCASLEVRGKRVVLIVPDGTRTCPIDVVFPMVHARLERAGATFEQFCPARLFQIDTQETEVRVAMLA